MEIQEAVNRLEATVFDTSNGRFGGMRSQSRATALIRQVDALGDASSALIHKLAYGAPDGDLFSEMDRLEDTLRSLERAAQKLDYTDRTKQGIRRTRAAYDAFARGLRDHRGR